jgi:transposase
VARVELERAAGEMRVYLEHDRQVRWACSECGADCALYDHQAKRRWRHLDTCQLRTILHAQPPPSNCPVHGPRVVGLPWAEPGSHFTALYEAFVISWLREASQQAVAELLGITWEEAHAIAERAVRRGLARRQAGPTASICLTRTKSSTIRSAARTLPPYGDRWPIRPSCTAATTRAKR